MVPQANLSAGAREVLGMSMQSEEYKGALPLAQVDREKPQRPRGNGGNKPGKKGRSSGGGGIQPPDEPWFFKWLRKAWQSPIVRITASLIVSEAILYGVALLFLKHHPRLLNAIEKAELIVTLTVVAVILLIEILKILVEAIREITEIITSCPVIKKIMLAIKRWWRRRSGKK